MKGILPKGFIVALLWPVWVFADVAQEPLFLGGSVPGNLAIVPSVEFPTVDSVANLGDFDPDTTYIGYFDAAKCYDYSGSGTESERHFTPASVTEDQRCSRLWSGNYLNWAATQTIDPFRWALTGGLRAKDTEDETWLEKARHDGQGGYFPTRTISGSVVSDVTPFSASTITTEIDGYGKQMLFVLPGGTSVDAKYVSAGETDKYFVSVRVKVCDPDVGVEANCKAYSDGWKPEGLMQEYSDKIRYSVFGYLNDSDGKRDGGVLRAKQKFIGLTARDPDSGWASNGAAEWDGTTGKLVRNPDAADATATADYFDVTVEDSGAINYINKFGELNSNNFKWFDPVSELYYAATRYFRNLGPVPEYDTRYPTHNPTPDTTTREMWVDGFPVIRTWDDPIQYSCQKNVILGIGDVYTHKDQNLPGSPTQNDDNEPVRPAEVTADTDVDVVDLNDKVGALEDIDITGTNSFGSTRNDGYMIGLAYDAHTRDLRTGEGMDGKQTITTYWVDVRENQKLEDIESNQYWLTAKYGGFDPVCADDDADCTLPDISGPYDSDVPDPLPEHWWFTNGQELDPTETDNVLKRTDNYYPAGQANDMVAGLKGAFADIASALTSTSTALSFNKNKIEAGSLVYQALFDTTHWSGDLVATSVGTDGTLGETATWNAATKLDALTSDQINSRKIFTAGDYGDVGTGQNVSQVTTTGRDFKWDMLTDAQQLAILAGDTDEQLGNDRVDYLRGSRDKETGFATGSDLFRKRDSRLGDIVNSSPQYIHHENFGYSALLGNANFGTAGSEYSAYKQSDTYQNKPPLVVVGANDGMLHGFDASTTGGSELFAYAPVSVMDELYKLTDTDYVHQYFVDGTPRLGDAWLGEGVGWKTLAVATTGAGGSGVFALDISYPNTMTSSDLLWEFTDSRMGRLVQQPALVALANGEFGVVVTSGYDAPQNEAYVWILSASDGTPIKRFDLPDTSGELGTPLVVDLEADRVADRIYVGDTNGYVWRLDIDESNTAQWDAPATLKDGNTIEPLFAAQDATGAGQAITAPLSAIYSSRSTPLLLFGTGSFYRDGDEAVGDNPQINTFYGIYDTGSSIQGRNDEDGALLQQEILLETVKGDFSARVVSDNTITGSNAGWYLDLAWSESQGGPGAKGERVVSRAALSGSQAVFSTLIPSADPCTGGGESWIMAIELESGSRADANLFDYNGDGVVDHNDGIEVTTTDENGDEVTEVIPGSGSKSDDIGVVSEPDVENGEDGKRWLCYSGSSDTTPRCVLMSGSLDLGRISWRELTEE